MINRLKSKGLMVKIDILAVVRWLKRRLYGQNTRKVRGKN